ncbi:MAG: hypothetical protein AAF655_12045 [Bacteroidota bacterium]
MFDFLKVIGQAIRGNKNLKKSPSARKHIWVLVISMLAGIALSVFTGSISAGRYGDMLNHKALGIAISAGIAITIFILINFLGLYAVEKWRFGKSRVYPEGAILAFVVLLFICGNDSLQNWGGKTDFSYQASGLDSLHNISPTTLTGPIDSKYKGLIAAEEKIKDDILKVYTWKGKTWFKPTKWHPQAEYSQHKTSYDAAQARIDTLKNQRDRELGLAMGSYKAQLKHASSKNQDFNFSLGLVVIMAYVAMLALSLLNSFCMLICEEALYGKIEINEGGYSTYGQPSWVQPPSPTAHASPPYSGGDPQSTQPQAEIGYPTNKGNNSPNNTQKSGELGKEYIYGNIPPDNTNKKYNTTQSAQARVGMLQLAYDKLKAQGGGKAPSKSALARELKWDRKTVGKYFQNITL